VSTGETIEIIKNAVAAIRGKTKVDGNVIKAKWKSRRYRTTFAKKFTFYVGKDMVRVAMKDGAGESSVNMRIKWEYKCRDIFIIWDEFIKELARSYPELNFDMESGDRYHIVDAKLMSDGVTQTFSSTSVSRPSIGGALIGGALFGGVGAIVGGSGGKTRTSGKTQATFSREVLVAARYSNGLNLEGVIHKNKPVYDKIMAGLCEVSEK
jgi:hypothetical protein